MKRKQLLIIFMVMLMTSVPVVAQKFNYTYNGVTITYEIISVPNHEVKVHYVPENVTEVTVPAVVHFNGEAFRVTKIGGGGSRSGGLFSSYEGDGYYSFEKCKILKTVVLPNTIREIEAKAFTDCTWLRSINLPSSLEIIGAWAFHGCVSLTTIALPSSLKKIGNNAFDGCINLNLASVKIPASIKTLKGNVFLGGTLFSGKGTLYIPATIDTIEYLALAGCDFYLSEQLGVLIHDTIVINTGDHEVKYDDFWKGFPMYFGRKEINREAFGSKYTVIGLDIFRVKVVSSPKYYLSTTFGKPAASYVKKSLIDAGKYEDVLAYYPNDVEVQKMQRDVEVSRTFQQGDAKRDEGNYSEAKQIYAQVLTLSPGNSEAKARMDEMDKAIAEQERQRREEEIRRRRYEEESNVRSIVNRKAKQAEYYIEQGWLQKAAISLQQALDTAAAHNYDYRTGELSQRIDSIRQVQATIADTSKTLDYRTFRPDLYLATQNVLRLKIMTYMKERDKDVENNVVSFTLYTNNQPGNFQLTESTRALNKFCKETLESVRLQQLVIDDQPLKASATYSYYIEYASGTVKVQQMNGRPQNVNVGFDMSPQLESDLTRVLKSRLGALMPDCDGNYRFNVTSMNVDGQMEHDIKLKSLHTLNGPQNAWRSLFVPFWGDQYVGGGLFGDGGYLRWYGAFLCYASVGYGIYSIIDETQYNSTANVGYYIGMITIGGAVWLGDVIYVWIKGAKNKKECKERVRRMSFTYDAVHDAPELVYSLKF